MVNGLPLKEEFEDFLSKISVKNAVSLL